MSPSGGALPAFTAYAVAATERVNPARYLGKGTVISLLFYLVEGAASKAVERALNATTAPIQDLSVNHCCAYVPVGQQFLNRANVVAVDQHVRCERMR